MKCLSVGTFRVLCGPSEAGRQAGRGSGCLPGRGENRWRRGRWGRGRREQPDGLGVGGGPKNTTDSPILRLKEVGRGRKEMGWSRAVVVAHPLIPILALWRQRQVDL
jgi:hypothetical protein